MGQSRAMYIVELDCESSGPRTVVVRVEQWGLLGTDSKDEVRVMRALRDAGYPSPRSSTTSPAMPFWDSPSS